MFAAVLAAAIALEGVGGTSLSARSALDANNVRVGDPMSLTVDFIGDADFTSLHPPALSREVDGSVWKIDDAGAKTTTWNDARRLVYRIRPLKEGVLEFPALVFSYENAATGAREEISTLPIPVRAKAGAQVALAGLDDAPGAGMPRPDGIFADLSASPWKSGEGLSADERFLWRKACARLNAEDFARFDFPEARLNEAACELMAGNWARALKIYNRLEWSIGQTPAIERGIVAAAALENSDPSAELPVWRQILRPVLRFAWKGRVLSVLLAFAGLSLLLFAAGRLIKALVTLVLAFLPAALQADSIGDMFKMMEERHRQMQEEMLKGLNMMGGGAGGMPGFSMSFNGMDVPPPEIKAFVKTDKNGVSTGEDFNFIVELEMPKSCTVSAVRFDPSRTVALVQTGKTEILTDMRSSNPSNVVRRMSIPCRYDAPFKDRLTFTVSGMFTTRIALGDGRRNSFTQQFSSNFSTSSNALWFEVKAPAGAGEVEGYRGAVGKKFSVSLVSANVKVATNDIVKAVYRLDYGGYMPDGGVEREIGRETVQGGGSVVFAAYTVADGRGETDKIRIPWYDVAAKKYRTAEAPGLKLEYVADGESESDTVVVNREEKDGEFATLRFAPSASAPAIGEIDLASPGIVRTETVRGYVRVDDGRRAGWVRKEDFK